MKSKLVRTATVALLLIILLASLGGFICFKIFTPKKEDNGVDPSVKEELFLKPVSVNSKIGVAYSVTGTVKRSTPECKNEELARYPVYGRTLTKEENETSESFTALKQAILAENAYLNADPDATLSKECSNYDSLDCEGYMYLKGEPVLNNGEHRRLYKHTAADGMYFGNVSDEERAVVKQIKIRPRQTGNYVTGLYAPAGEVIKLTISDADLQGVGGFYVYVGATLANGQANNIWLARDFNRMPVIANKMPVNAEVCDYDEASKTYTCYFGSYLGGPVYVGTPNYKNEFQVEISGAVEYPHLIYGLTTENEYNELLKSSAPYFDLEVFDNTVRFSGPRTYSDKYSYKELCEAAELWDKIARVSKQVPTGSNASYGIDFLFEPFVAAGAAVAFVGRNTVNCPTDWMDACLNVENFVDNGSWGNIHEFNHHFQNYGLPNGGEVTNNAISLVEYSLFTKISAKRSLNDNTLTDWNAYTDPSRALRILIENSDKGNPVQSLDAYATVLHSFGQSVFIEATKNGSGADKWFKNLCELTHYDFTYYFTEALNHPLSQSVIDEIKGRGYPVYVPVASIYQTGTKYSYNGVKRQITTVQPFEFSTDSYEFNVKSLINVPSGFTVTGVTVGKPEYGELVRISEDTYRFTPSNENVSGDIDVTVSIKKDDEAFTVEDVNLVFGFKKKQRQIAERSTYYFDEDISSVFQSVDDAVQKNYAGYDSSATFESTFNGKECAAVWWNSEGVKLNSITEYNSKINITENGTYRFSIRGKYANLYISLDGESYELVAKAGTEYNNNFNVSVQNGEYKDYRLERGRTVFIKAVVMHVDVQRCSFVVGMCKVEGGVASLDDVTKKTTVYNVDYCREEFKTDFFYTREYPVTEFTFKTNDTSSVISTNFSPWDSTTELENLFDGNPSTFMHNKKNEYVTEASPFEMTVDLGKKISANKIIMYGRSYNTQTPISYKLYGGLEQEEMTLLCEYTNEPLKNGHDQVGSFVLAELRYYKLVVTKTSANYICLVNIEFGIDFPGGNLLSPDDEIANYYGEWTVNYDLSPFGHSYVTKGGYIEIDFVGSQFAVISRTGKSARFAVSVDGRQEVVIESDGTDELIFLCDATDGKPRKIVIRAITEIDIAAFAIR